MESRDGKDLLLYVFHGLPQQNGFLLEAFPVLWAI